MEKIAFLTNVSEIMKGMISYEDMMASIQRSCMRPEAENLDLMKTLEEDVDRLIKDVEIVGELEIAENVLDALVLRYLRNTQFLSNLKEDDIDASGLGDELSYWKKTMLFKTPV